MTTGAYKIGMQFYYNNPMGKKRSVFIMFQTSGTLKKNESRLNLVLYIVNTRSKSWFRFVATDIITKVPDSRHTHMMMGVSLVLFLRNDSFSPSSSSMGENSFSRDALE